LSLRVKKLASKLHVHSVNYAANIVHTVVFFPAFLSTLIRRRFQVKPAALLIPIDFYLYLLVEFYGTRYQSGFFSLMWGVVFTACVVFPREKG
jgi:hypothetical protein